jgi:hypothetical protein
MALLVYGRPGAALCFLLGNPAVLVTLLDMFSLTLLFVGVTRLVTSGHDGLHNKRLSRHAAAVRRHRQSTNLAAKRSAGNAARQNSPLLAIVPVVDLLLGPVLSVTIPLLEPAFELILPLITSMSSSVSLPHCSFTLPFTCFQFPSTRFQSIASPPEFGLANQPLANACVPNAESLLYSLFGFPTKRALRARSLCIAATNRYTRCYDPTFVDEYGLSSVCHYFLTNGMLQYLRDSTHALAGQTVALPELPIGYRNRI